MPRTRHILSVYVYDALNNRFWFSISVQPEIDCTTFQFFFMKCLTNIFLKIFKSWQVCDWLAKWIIMLEFMDRRWPRVCRRSSVGLVQSTVCNFCDSISHPQHYDTYTLDMKVFESNSKQHVFTSNVDEGLMVCDWHALSLLMSKIYRKSSFHAQVRNAKVKGRIHFKSLLAMMVYLYHINVAIYIYICVYIYI